jgi:hypothetical protein
VYVYSLYSHMEFTLLFFDGVHTFIFLKFSLVHSSFRELVREIQIWMITLKNDCYAVPCNNTKYMSGSAHRRK